ncbi:MAG: 2-C-methyl-D-erythritol 4-phosphate cytidylyltransferase [Ilumatobacteraceae bacterium]
MKAPRGASSVVWTVVVAGGTGTRFGRPKQYESLGDERVIDRSHRIAASVSDGVIIVVPEADRQREGGVAGGATRSDSVRAGLAAVPTEATVICVHDAARPLATPELYRKVVAAVEAGADGAVPALPVTDTVKVVAGDGSVVSTPERASLRTVQTPQAFRADVLRAAHAGGGEATDDAELVERAGGRVVVVDGEALNRKITMPDDLDWARTAIAREFA